MHPFLQTEGPIAFAHRGGALEFPENTMRAFAGAVDMGFRYLETDVYATADGQVVAFHDDQLDRVTDKTGRIEDLSFDEISKARIAGRDPIPRLQALLTAWPDVRVNIDPKHDLVVEPLIKIIKDLNCHPSVCIGSFSSKRLKAFREAFGRKICLAAGPGEVMRLAAAAYGMPLSRFDADCAQIPPKTKVGGVSVPLVTQALIERAHKDGVHVHVWTIDTAEEMGDLFDQNVDGIMTDRPSVLKRVMQDRGVWS